MLSALEQDPALVLNELMRQNRCIDLYDMLIKLNGHNVAYAYGYLANAQGLSGNEPVTRSLPEDQKLTLLQALDFVEETAKTLNLELTALQIPRLRADIANAEKYNELITSIGTLRLRMHDELKTRLFLYIPPVEAKFYGLKQPFGQDVEVKFADCISDIEESGDCIALSKSTAAVFHLMRVMERGVQRLGAKLGVTNVTDKNWQNILDEINKRLSAGI